MTAVSRERADGDRQGTDVVQSFERGLRVIRALVAEPPGRTLSDIARTADLNRATTRRLLQTLIASGYARSDGRSFELTPRVLELGYSYLSGLTVPGVAKPHLDELVAATNETCSVAVLDGDDIVFVARSTPRRVITYRVEVGTRLRAHHSSTGRVLLASLDDDALDAYLHRADLDQPSDGGRELRAELQHIRRDGYALIDQEHDEDLRSVAVPIHAKDGVTVAAATISTAASRTTLDHVRADLLPALRDTVARIEADLLGRAT